MRYLFTFYFAYKKQIKKIFDFIKYWLFVFIFAFYVAIVYTYGINFIAIVLFVWWLGILSGYITELSFLTVRYFKKRKLRGKKNEFRNED